MTDEAILERCRNATIVGAGVIGLSWAALFLDHGLTVTVNDPAPDAEQRVTAGIATLIGTGHEERLRFEPDLATAVADADIVQENGPEKERFKRELWVAIEAATKPQALLLSSSSGITASRQCKDMADPGRLIIGHPFNPPHLIPLVEVVPTPATPSALIDQAMAFYTALGKHAVLIHKEVPGFVANRLQAVFMRECVGLVQAGVVTPAQIDEIVTASLGPRWATDGPYTSFTMGGGPGGFKHFLDHFAQGLTGLWASTAAQPAELVEPEAQATLLEQVTAGISQDVPALEARREERLRAVLELLD